MMTSLIELCDLTVELPTPAGWIRPVDDVSFTLEAGESLGLVGESGSGKSMLALALMGLLPPGAKVRGEAWLAGANGASGSRANLLTLAERERIGVRGRDIAMIFQEPMTALNPVMRVGAQIAEAIRAHNSNLSARRSESPRAGSSRTRRCPRARHTRAAISASTVRRVAAARHDRHGSGLA